MVQNMVILHEWHEMIIIIYLLSVSSSNEQYLKFNAVFICFTVKCDCVFMCFVATI